MRARWSLVWKKERSSHGIGIFEPCGGEERSGFGLRSCALAGVVVVLGQLIGDPVANRDNKAYQAAGTFLHVGPFFLLEADLR